MAPGDGVNQIGFASVLAVAHLRLLCWPVTIGKLK